VKRGQWVGGSAARLGLEGQVDADDLRAVLAGLAPGNGGLTDRSPNARSPTPKKNDRASVTTKLLRCERYVVRGRR
jgi:hypothetical protein